MSQHFSYAATPTATRTPTPTLEERLKALRGLGDSLDVLTRTSPILEALAAFGAAPVPFGARTSDVAREAADLVTRRRDKNFKNAPFSGDDITGDAEELRLAQAIKAKADEFAQLAGQAVGGCSARIGDKLRSVVKVVNAGMMDPFYEDPKGLASDSAAMRGQIDAYNAGIQATKQSLGALRADADGLRGDNAGLAAENERLRLELQLLRDGRPSSPVSFGRPTGGAAVPAGRRGRKNRR